MIHGEGLTPVKLNFNLHRITFYALQIARICNNSFSNFDKYLYELTLIFGSNGFTRNEWQFLFFQQTILSYN